MAFMNLISLPAACCRSAGTSGGTRGAELQITVTAKSKSFVSVVVVSVEKKKAVSE